MDRNSHQSSSLEVSQPSWLQRTPLLNSFTIFVITAFKVICLTFGETFTTQEWHKVAQWILSLTRTQLVSPTRPISKKISTTSIVSNESSGRSSRSSVSSGSGEETYSERERGERERCVCVGELLLTLLLHAPRCNIW